MSYNFHRSIDLRFLGKIGSRFSYIYVFRKAEHHCLHLTFRAQTLSISGSLWDRSTQNILAILCSPITKR